ncbi:SixA phosphatase family protein [Nocardioides dongxiaopingii]|uniref:SixA phosphatase family protein n=1 Tax=Nocardioides dongxiaopingii TaxID=2576036 RepID=UPI0010C7688D|nr:histidine phosphatase family protein [Nocardioides dongxiaopingii]
MVDTPRTLVVMRHARAESLGTTDFDRALTEGGRADAADGGRWLAGFGVVPQHALVSAAVRTAQTWRETAAAAGWVVEPELDRGLYAADVDNALDLVRALDEAVTSAVVVGHNPTVAALAQLLDDDEGDVEAGNAMATGSFPTSATAVFTCRGSWADVQPGSAALVGYHVGRG